MMSSNSRGTELGNNQVTVIDKFFKAMDTDFNSAKAIGKLFGLVNHVTTPDRLEDEAESLIEDGEMGDVQFDDEGGEGDGMVVQRDLDRVISSQSRQTVEENRKEIFCFLYWFFQQRADDFPDR